MQISDQAKEIVWNAENECKTAFERVESIEMITQSRVLEAFQSSSVASRNFAPSTGYGYDDISRDTLDIVFANALQADSALVRTSFVNGSHALFTALAGICLPGDTIVFATGKPYDTLEEAVGLRGNSPQSLKNFGINILIIPLNDDGTINRNEIVHSVSLGKKIVYFQRSRGYEWRDSFGQDCLEDIFSEIHAVSPDSIIFVDNCYCEFCEVNEPVYYGADLMAGSLIKNPGGGLAPTGGYAAGNSDLVQQVAQRLTVPGIGGEVGSFSGDYRLFYQGLFMAPHIVSQGLKTAILFASVFSKLGYQVLPAISDKRFDIVESIRFNTAEELIAFCQSIQKASPVESNLNLEPWEMPGYDHDVIMAAGTFVQGATSELSADGPVCAPFVAYLQGSLTYTHGRIAAMYACDRILQSRGKNQ